MRSLGNNFITNLQRIKSIILTRRQGRTALKASLRLNDFDSVKKRQVQSTIGNMNNGIDALTKIFHDITHVFFSLLGNMEKFYIIIYIYIET